MPRSPEFLPPEISQEKSEKSELESLRQEVLQYLEEKRSVAEKIEDPKERSDAHAFIALREYKIGLDPTKTFLCSKEATRLIKNKKDQQEDLRNLADVQAKCGLFDEAKATAKEIRYIFQRNLAYKAIARQEDAAGLYDQAIETIKRTGEKHNVDILKTFSYKKVKEREIKEEHFPIDYFEREQERIKEIENDDKRDMQCFSLAVKAAKNGHIQKAKEIAENIVEPALRGSGFLDITMYEKRLARAAETEEERLKRVYEEILGRREEE